ncbi:MAG: glycosyltransferase [Planctomycetes bacterium]|nr:glycosyltransferase [Planctomycetota bacterium]
MRIAVLTSLYPSATRPHEGLFAERRWSGMRARGHEVRIVQPVPRAPFPVSLVARYGELAAMPEREERVGITIERPRYLHLPRAARGNAARFATRGMELFTANTRPDVVVCDYAWPAAVAAHACAREKLACVISGRGSDVLQVAGEAGLGDELASALKAAGHWCAVSQDLVRRMDELAGAPGRGVLVANGVDLELFALRDRERTRAELGVDPKLALVLVVGHLIERKDPLLALRSFLAWTKSTAPFAKLVFIGRGPLEAAVRAEADTAGMQHAVELVGEKPPTELARWYAAADALLLTSSREGRPNVVLEALASGLPVVATRAGGTAELLEGLPHALAGTRDPDEIGRLLALTLSSRPNAATLHARVEPLSWRASFETLEALLERALAESRGGAR